MYLSKFVIFRSSLEYSKPSPQPKKFQGIRKWTGGIGLQ
jgi:hypothetical protein